MMRLRWKSGPLNGWEGPFFVSATRFTYRHPWHLPLVFWHGLKLRRCWARVDGAIGLSIMADVRTRTTYTLSVWRGGDDLRRWVRSPDHARLMHGYRPRMKSSAAYSWQTTTLELRQLWREGMGRVGLEVQPEERAA